MEENGERIEGTSSSNQVGRLPEIGGEKDREWVTCRNF